MRTHSRLITVLMLIVFIGKMNAQSLPMTNFYTQARDYDLSTVLMADSILIEDGKNNEKVKRAEPLGFIGDDYQRFYIHFISIIQNPVNEYEYLAYGKTRVKGTTCSFQGRITIKQAGIKSCTGGANCKQGIALCDVILYEDRKQASTGFIKGELKSSFIIDDKGKLRYDALMFVADGFSNNEFTGTWTSYKTKATKKCNWGDYRIPDCGDLDNGAGEFSVNDKYLKNGWESNRHAWLDPASSTAKEARQKEEERWWE